MRFAVRRGGAQGFRVSDGGHAASSKLAVLIISRICHATSGSGSSKARAESQHQRSFP